MQSIDLTLVRINGHDDLVNFGMINDFATELHAYTAPRYAFIRSYVDMECSIKAIGTFAYNQPMSVVMKVSINAITEPTVDGPYRMMIEKIVGIDVIHNIMSMPQPYREHHYADFWNRQIIDSFFKFNVERFAQQGFAR